jgi:serine protease inhibitor
MSDIGLLAAILGAMRYCLGFALLAACTSAPDVMSARQIPADVAPDVAAIVQANNAFACDVYTKLSTEPGNLFFSPFSMSTALAMIDAGAAGDTAAQLRSALHFTLPADRQNAAYGAVLASLDRGRDYGEYSLATANRLFGQAGYPFLPSFLAVTRDQYGAELEPIDFGDAAAATATINQWVSEQTEGKIPELFEPGVLDSATRLVLANAIYFKGRWELEFNPAEPGPFFRADGSMVTVPIMGKQDPIDVGVIRGADGTVLAQLGVLPFRGKDLSMIVLLPTARDGLPQLEAQLTAAALGDWLAAPRAPLDPRSFVWMPKFHVESSFHLIRTLQELGIHDAFDPSLADLSGMTGGRELFVQSTEHKAWIAVDEHGAEAAAATGAGVGIVSLPPSFQVDHPFVFLIYDEVTHSVLFMGRVEQP